MVCGQLTPKHNLLEVEYGPSFQPQLLTILSLLVVAAEDGTGVRVVVLEALELLLDFLLQAVLQSRLLLALGVVVAQVVVLQIRV
jgi:hypothetical protein